VLAPNKLKFMWPYFCFQDRSEDGTCRGSAVLVAVCTGSRPGRRCCARLDTAERVAYTDKQPAGGRVADGVRPWPGPELHQAGRAQESAQGTGAVVHHAGGDHHQHGAFSPAAAHRAADHGAPPAPEPDGRPGAAVQVVRHAYLHQSVHVGHKWVAAELQVKEDQHI